MKMSRFAPLSENNTMATFPKRLWEIDTDTTQNVDDFKKTNSTKTKGL